MASKYATYKIVSLHDPAIAEPVLPDLELPPGAGPDDDGQGGRAIAAHKAAVDAAFDAWITKLRVARERQDWSEVVAEGKTPRLHVMRWLPDDVRAWWHDQRRNDETGGGGPLGAEQHMRLLVRIALHSLEGDKPRTFRLLRNESVEWDIADREALDELRAVWGPLYLKVLADLGRQVFEQEARGRPL